MKSAIAVREVEFGVAIRPGRKKSKKMGDPLEVFELWSSLIALRNEGKLETAGEIMMWSRAFREVKSDAWNKARIRLAIG